MLKNTSEKLFFEAIEYLLLSLRSEIIVMPIVNELPANRPRRISLEIALNTGKLSLLPGGI